MKKETRTICYDEDLRIEAYHFGGIVQPFPNHFHEHYVIGFVENGRRILSCCNNEYVIDKGNIVIFNPHDNHACVQSDDGTFDYRGFNIEKNVMLDLSEEVTGKRELPQFSPNVIHDEELNCYLQPLHELVMTGSNEFEKEEYLLLMISGFSDQSHFTNFFNKFIGLSPRVYRDIFMKNTDKGGSHNGKE
jgi:hypothetical protein